MAVQSPPRDRDPDGNPRDQQTANYGRLAISAVLTAATVRALMSRPGWPPRKRGRRPFVRRPWE